MRCRPYISRFQPMYAENATRTIAPTTSANVSWKNTLPRLLSRSSSTK